MSKPTLPIAQAAAIAVFGHGAPGARFTYAEALAILHMFHTGAPHLTVKFKTDPDHEISKHAAARLGFYLGNKKDENLTSEVYPEIFLTDPDWASMRDINNLVKRHAYEKIWIAEIDDHSGLAV